ncbi:longitudinals lacking protein, isoforms H/M/V isoform X6 [Coccinella septempunctata]|uniref:longitudinals lacking protein, isoforms H/M/V isoform X6 n=1 Tax=Coccinella septempunctata TaxID=41139 RepID=UPI001D080F3E|nr:longitudinals lacking protein, isoforms H/M/V isoform X6 [Coccinella septempunctata]
MEDDQQFCLRWNNHQSTLVSVFDTLLESGTLVDCTLAAEGKYLNAHKVVLSACSPYFESLLSKHYDKHPILILKDVKFQELKAMMDYMYRGEVNISQDQLGALLKAAESLQIKGLSDNRKGGDVKPAAPIQPKSPQPASTIPKVQGLTIEQRTRDDSREGSQSPGPRKKKRIRRKSEDLDNHDVHSNSSESHSNHGPTAQNIPLPAPSKLAADVPEPLETKSEIILRHKPSDEMIPQVPIKEKIETHTELMLEPKSEYVEEMNEDSIEDLTLDDDDMSNMEHMGDGAGPSHGNMGEGSSQGFGSWHLGNQSQDEVFLAAQEAVGAHRDSQDYEDDDDDDDEDDFEEAAEENFVYLEDLERPSVKCTTVRPAHPLKKPRIATPKSEYRVIRNTRPPRVSQERMKLFLSMSPSDIKPKAKKKLACERDLDEMPKPVDRLRCPLCGILRERMEHIRHVKTCKGTAPTIQYGCTDCSFKHFDIGLLRDHIRSVHMK